MRFLLALLVASLLIPFASGAQPSVDVTTLYAHGTGTDEFMGFMDTSPDGGDDTAMGSGNALTGGTNTWEWILQPSLERGLMLDPAGTIEVTAYVGGSQSVGSVDVSTTLSSGDVVVAEGPTKTHTITPASAGDGLYGVVSWSITPAVESIAGFENLVWSLTVTGDASAVFVGVGEERGRSNIDLPITGVEAMEEAPIALNGTAPEIVLGGEEPDSRTLRFAWTTDAPNITARVDASVATGNVSYKVMAGKATLLDTNATGNMTQEDLVDLTPYHVNGTANVTVVITTDAFTGTFSLHLKPPTPAPAPKPTTVIEPEDDTPAQESPLPLAVLVVALVAVAFARRP